MKFRTSSSDSDNYQCRQLLTLSGKLSEDFRTLNSRNLKMRSTGSLEDLTSTGSNFSMGLAESWSFRSGFTTIQLSTDCTTMGISQTVRLLLSDSVLKALKPRKEHKQYSRNLMTRLCKSTVSVPTWVRCKTGCHQQSFSLDCRRKYVGCEIKD